MLRLKGSCLAQRADAPMPSLFWAAGLSFSRSQLLTEVSQATSPIPVGLVQRLGEGFRAHWTAPHSLVEGQGCLC